MACSWSVSPLATARPPPAAIRAYARAISVLPTIELSSSRNSVLLKSGVSRCAAAAACHAERTPVSAHPRRRCASPRPHGAWAPAPQHGDAHSPAACSRLTSPPGTVWSYPHRHTLYHRETVGRFQYHTGGGTLSRRQCLHEFAGYSLHQRRDRLLTFENMAKNTFSASYDARETSRPVP